ncbi:DUF4340 domain-containing protein [bacterium]|nr:DUF4340 domain-containing protein [bacterium]
MSKSIRSTLVLLAVLGGLVAWYAIYENRVRPKQAEKEEQAKLFVTTPADSIQEISIEQRQGEAKDAKYRTVTLKKAGSEWNLTSPVEDRGDNNAASGLVSLLTSSKQDRVVDEDPKDLETFGLAVPKLKIHVKKDSASPAEELWVGNDTPVGAGVYLKLASKKTVYRAAEAFRSNFEKDPSEYRSKKVLSISRPDVSEMEIRTGGENFVLKRSDGEKWVLAREGLPASTLEVNKVLNDLVDLTAKGFAAESTTTPAKYGLAPAKVVVTLTEKETKSTISYGQVGDKYYAKRGDKGIIFEIGKDSFDKAVRPAKDYRDLKMANFNRFNIRRIKLEHGKEGFELTKPESDWKLAADLSAKIDSTKVEEYLTRLQDIHVSAYLPAGQKPKSTDLTVRLFEKKGDSETEALVLHLQKPQGKSATGSRVGLDRSFTLSEPDYKKVNAFKQEFLASEKS